MTLEQALGSWDGKSAATIQTIYTDYSADPEFITRITTAIANPDYSQAATWLLKYYCETGRILAPNAVDTIISALPLLTHWQAKLHILQSMTAIAINRRHRKKVESFLRNCLTHDNKFVRAWTYSGFFELARQHPQYRKETKQLIELALRDEAPSIKARLRQLDMKQLNDKNSAS